MNIVILVMSICSFILGAFMFFSPWEGNKFLVFLIKTIGFISLFTSCVYWLQLLNVIN